MKVVKMPNTDFHYSYTCNNCTAELQVEKDDLLFHSEPGDMRDPAYDRWCAVCPVCKKVFDVQSKFISKAVQAEIKSKKRFEGQ